MDLDLDFRTAKEKRTSDRHRSKKDRHKRRGDRHAPRTKWEAGTFVFWDSEGAAIDGAHRMIVLANSQGGSITDSAGISTARALRFMTAEMLRLRPLRPIHCGFAFDYDTNMVLRDLPLARLRRLWDGRWVTWERKFRLNYRPRKSFYIGARYSGRKVGAYIWDVFGFFQSSFVVALRKYGLDDDAAWIESMKERRPTFRSEELDEIARYCVRECELGVMLMERVRVDLEEAGLKVARWDGAGAVAAALLRREGVKDHLGDLPPAVDTAARHAYFGGRMELVRYGHAPARTIWEHDIRSAYPAAAADLPCLACGEWWIESDRSGGQRLGFVNSPFALYRVRWDLPQSVPIMPFPWRAPDGRIYFPPRGEGWYWAPEVRAAWKAVWGARPCYAGRRSLEILERIAWVPGCDHQPFRFVPELYERRAQWKREGRGAEKALKLGLNSLYGKLAQKLAERGSRPPYHNLPWAGWITSETRARMYDAALAPAARGELVAVATDALYTASSKPLPVREGQGLGEWEIIAHAGITAVQAGVYWTGAGESEAAKFRGFDRGALKRSAVVDGWRAGVPCIEAPHTRFIGMGLALHQGAERCSWSTVPRKLSLAPNGTKREPTNNGVPARGLVDTLPVDPHWWQKEQPMSAPVVRPWDPEPEAEDSLEEWTQRRLEEEAASWHV